MKTKLSLFGAILVAGLGALTTGCYAETGYVVTNDARAYEYASPSYAYASPALVAAGPNVWIVNGQPSVYYSDNSYWTYSGNTWYRSSYSNGGWVAVNAAPVVVVNHYHHSSNVGYSHPAHHVPARPHVARHSAQPRVRVKQPRVGQSHVRVHSNSSKPGPSSRSKANGHVGAKPSVRADKSVHVPAKPSVRPSKSERSSTSSRTGVSSHSSNSSSSHGRSHGRR